MLEAVGIYLQVTLKIPISCSPEHPNPIFLLTEKIVKADLMEDTIIKASLTFLIRIMRRDFSNEN